MMIYLIVAGIILVIGIAVFVYAYFIEPNRLIVREVLLQGDIKKAITIAHFSDVHFGRFKDADKAKTLVEMINTQHPDLVLFTGDMIDNYAKTPNMVKDLQPYLHAIQSTYGKYAVYGNHDIGGGARRIFSDFMNACGFQVLKNDYIEIPELQIAILGTDDPQAGYENPEISKTNVQPYQILMSHEPDFADKLDLATIDLMISGHTHGGQISLPILTRFFLPNGGQKYVKGMYYVQNSKLFVSSGVGMTFMPFRLGNTPEIVIYHVSPMKK